MTDFEDVIDIEDGVAVSGLSTLEDMHNETEVSPLFLTHPDEFIPKDWMIDLLERQYNIVSVDEEQFITSLLNQLYIHGYEEVSITIDGKEYK